MLVFLCLSAQTGFLWLEVGNLVQTSPQDLGCDILVGRIELCGHTNPDIHIERFIHEFGTETMH
jgi:hypothetical protein